MLAGGTVLGQFVDEITGYLVENKVFTKTEIKLISKQRGFAGVVRLDKIREV